MPVNLLVVLGCVLADQRQSLETMVLPHPRTQPSPSEIFRRLSRTRCSAEGRDNVWLCRISVLTSQKPAYLCCSDQTGEFLECSDLVPALILVDSAGKSTVLSILGNLIGRDSGTVTFEGGFSRPPRGTLGIVPQKNVLFPELTCFQTLRVWSAVKRLDNTESNEDINQLLRDCDLEEKIHCNANNLSGGQKRKLQLGIGIVGGSKSAFIDQLNYPFLIFILVAVLLVDEVS